MSASASVLGSQLALASELHHPHLAPVFNCHRRAGLKEAYCRWRSAAAGRHENGNYRVPSESHRILISREILGAPCDELILLLVNVPWRAAISRIARCAIVSAGMLRRCVESNVTYVNSGGHAEGLNCAVEIHVKERILSKCRTPADGLVTL